MNHRGGLALIKSTWASWMQHRGFFFLLAFGWMMPMLVYLFVWSAAAGEGTVEGFGRDTFAAYYLALILVNQLTYAQTNWTVGDLIRMGDMNTLLLRPMSPLYNALASEIAGKVVMMAFAVPVTGALALALKPRFDVSPREGVAFVIAVALAWMLRFLWGYWLALLAFWASRADGLLAVQDAMVFLLGGQVAPTALLPGAVRAAAILLPFRYMLGFPVEVLTGGLSDGELAAGFVLQIAWLAAAVILYRALWRRGLRHYAAVGG